LKPDSDYFGLDTTPAPGRFTSADPLLSSGSIYDPQTWNLYSYTLNNPLKYVDPFGLYEWDASLGGSATDEELKKRKGGQKILDRRNDFRNALAKAASDATSKSLNEKQRAEINRAVKAYGPEGHGERCVGSIWKNFRWSKSGNRLRRRTRVAA